MPRSETPRRRVARACDNCKRRKEKCDGLLPCMICTRRRKQSECQFTDTPAAALQGRGRRESVLLSETMTGTNQSEMAIEHLLNAAAERGDLPRQGQSTSGSPRDSISAVPKLARLLKDSQGKFMFIGDSATLSFLQSVRRLVFASNGECDFTTDNMRHSILETIPRKSTEGGNGHAPFGITMDRALQMAQQYLLVTNGVLNVLDMDYFHEHLPLWVRDPSHHSEDRSSIFYLVMAIGAQVASDASNQEEAEHYFHHGRQLAFSTFTEAPSIRTVQSYALICIYMLGACRRNGAFMNLGIAVRAAYALGIHKQNTHALFPENERRTRRQVWKAVRFLDLFLSGSLGRPPATYDFGNDAQATSSRASSNATEEESFSAAVSTLCRVQERILIDVYMKQLLSTDLATAISGEFREWAGSLPPALRMDYHDQDTDSPEKLPELLAVAHVIATYYWSIILLTRPFLLIQASFRIKRRNETPKSTTPAHSDTTTLAFADACIDSALRAVAAASALLHHDSLPQRLPVLLNTVFNASLVLGIAVLADYDQDRPLNEGMEQAERFIRHFATDPHACRYAQIIGYLKGAVQQYIQRRNAEIMEKRSRQVARLFGNVGNPVPLSNNVTPSNMTATGPHTPLSPSPAQALPFEDAGHLEPPSAAYGMGALQGSYAQPDGLQDLDGHQLPSFAPFGDVLTPFPEDALFYVEEDLPVFGLPL